MVYTHEIVSRIKEEASKSGLNMSELASKLEITSQALSNTLSRKSLKIDFLDRICSILKTDLHYLVYGINITAQIPNELTELIKESRTDRGKIIALKEEIQEYNNESMIDNCTNRFHELITPTKIIEASKELNLPLPNPDYHSKDEIEFLNSIIQDKAIQIALIETFKNPKHSITNNLKMFKEGLLSEETMEGSWNDTFHLINHYHKLFLSKADFNSIHNLYCYHISEKPEDKDHKEYVNDTLRYLKKLQLTNNQEDKTSEKKSSSRY